MKKLLLVDGNSLLHRAYHAYPSLTTSKGEVVGAVYGFSLMLLTTIEKLQPTHLAVAWDVSRVTFRHKVYKEYKAGRPEMDEELLGQIERTKEAVGGLNIPQFGIKGYEADDVIGTLVKQVSQRGNFKGQVVIVTGDRDALQLVEGSRVVVYMPVSGFLGQGRGRAGAIKDRGIMIFDEEAVKTKYGLRPNQMIDLKGLMGDASDNIKGVAGVGQVTATRLLQQADSVEQIYALIDKIEASDRVKGLLLAGREAAKMSKQLVTINTKVPIKFSWKACCLADYDREKVVRLFEELEFKSLINKLPKDRWEEDLEEVFS